MYLEAFGCPVTSCEARSACNSFCNSFFHSSAICTSGGHLDTGISLNTCDILQPQWDGCPGSITEFFDLQLRFKLQISQTFVHTAGETFFSLCTRSLFKWHFQKEMLLCHVFREPLNASLPENIWESNMMSNPYKFVSRQSVGFTEGCFLKNSRSHLFCKHVLNPLCVLKPPRNPSLGKIAGKNSNGTTHIWSRHKGMSVLDWMRPKLQISFVISV